MTPRSLLRHGLALAVATAWAGAACATDLSGAMTVDDSFTAYLSTSPGELGTPLFSGSSWGTTSTLAPTALGGAPTYYLHVAGTNGGPPGGVLGTFALGDTDYEFANGSQTLLTGLAGWSVDAAPWGSPSQPLTPIGLGANGVGPWGTRPGIPAQAEWIWSADQCGSCTRYFTATIVSTVPEPASGAMLLAGLALAALAAGTGISRR